MWTAGQIKPGRQIPTVPAERPVVTGPSHRTLHSIKINHMKLLRYVQKRN